MAAHAERFRAPREPPPAEIYWCVPHPRYAPNRASSLSQRSRLLQSHCDWFMYPDSEQEFTCQCSVCHAIVTLDMHPVFSLAEVSCNHCGNILNRSQNETGPPSLGDVERGRESISALVAFEN